MKEEIEKKEKMIEKEMELKMIGFNNENILNNYRHEEEKKEKKKKELMDILIKSEKLEMEN
jgi:hypothetical protein